MTQDRLPDVNTLPLDIPKSCLFSRCQEGKCSSTLQHSGTSPTPTGSQLPKYYRIHSRRPSQPEDTEVIINPFLYF